MSKTPNAAQQRVFYNDKPNEFPSTPESIDKNPLTTYYENLNEGKVFFRNHNGEYIVVKKGFSPNRQSIFVLTRADYVYRENKEGVHIPTPISSLHEEVSIDGLPHSINEIVYDDNLFIHSKVESGFHPKEELEEIFAEYTQEL